MANAWHQPTTVYGQPTTIDLARHQTYNVPPAAGFKRPIDDIDHRQEKLPNQRVSLPQAAHAKLPDQVKAPFPPRLQASRIIPSESVEPARTPAQLRHVISSTPGPSQNPLLTLGHAAYGLPAQLVENFAALGVHAIYPWQSSCLLGKGLLTGEQNLVYTAPTGGGKSLVADVLLLKRIIDNPGQKAILVLPYVALVQEKLRWLRALVDGVSKNIEESDGTPNPTWRRPSNLVRVAGFFGGSKSTVNWADCDVAVCTIEKANSLVNSAIEEGKDAKLGILVLDELHMLNDEHRGYLMELLATKLMSLETPVQVVGMSATLPNPQLLAKWLKAKFYIAKYRPIPIEEHLVYNNGIYLTANAKEFFRTATQLTAGDALPTQRPEPLRTISRSEHRDLQNPMVNAVVALAVETALAEHGALVFCSSRQGVERTATLIADALPVDHVDKGILGLRQDLLASLHALPGGFESTFSKAVPCGVGFHHAGLTVEERNLVAEAYDTGVLKVMKADLEAVAELLEAEMPPVESCLTPEKRGIKRALLEVIGIRMASSRTMLDRYVHSSLVWHTTEHGTVMDMVETSIQELLESGLIRRTEYEDCLEPTSLGTAVVASSLSPEDGVFVHSELRRALESFVMDGDLHIFYLFTPVQTSGLAQISWPTFRDELDALDESGLRAIRLIGISPALVNRLVNSGGKLKEDTPEEERLARVYRRVYSAFQLRDLCNEMPVHEVSVKFSVPRGHIQNLAQTCHGFAAGMIKFCERMGWGMLAAVLEHMLDRLRAGARADLIEMAQVAFVKSRMARIFWENGFKSIRALGEADPHTLVPVMMQAQARKMKLQGEAAEKFKAKLLARAEIIVNSANRLWERQQQVQWDEE
ncbi:hypothetical protein KCU88_g6529, partial [Aureobasidium melanogenum]